MFLKADDELFRKILYDKARVLRSFLPDRPDIVYSFRARVLICKTSDLNERNFSSELFVRIVTSFIYATECW